MANETIFLVLFMVATTVAIAVRRLRIPYTVGLVLAGILLGIVQAFRAPQLTKALLFSIFLPGLLFEAAFHLDFREFWRNRMSILSLAVPGVVAATALTTVKCFFSISKRGWRSVLHEVWRRRCRKATLTRR